jgi:hypothetical protein
MMAGQDRPGQVIEAAAAALATVALAVPLFLIVAITGYRMARTARTADSIGPALLTDQIIAFLVIDERGEVDQLRDGHGDTESVENRRYRIDQSALRPLQNCDSSRVLSSWLQSHFTPLESRMSHDELYGYNGFGFGGWGGYPYGHDWGHHDWNGHHFAAVHGGGIHRNFVSHGTPGGFHHGFGGHGFAGHPGGFSHVGMAAHGQFTHS